VYSSVIIHKPGIRRTNYQWEQKIDYIVWRNHRTQIVTYIY